MGWLQRLFGKKQARPRAGTGRDEAGRSARNAGPIDPSAQDWYRRGNEHLQRGDKARTLICWEKHLSLTEDSSARANADGLRSALRPDERARYDQLTGDIRAQLEIFTEKKRRLYMFNLPHFLGIGPVDTSMLQKMSQ